MTEPRPEDDLNVPLRLQPVVARPEGWRGRSNSLVAVGLVGFVAIGLVLGTAFNNGGPSSSAALASASPGPASNSPPPSRRPTPTPVPLATRLPALEVLGGAIPTERRLVYANGMQVLDLATGTLTSPTRRFEDQLLPLGDDQLVCACVVRDASTGGDATAPVPILRYGRYDLTGKPIIERDLQTFDGMVPVPDMTEGFSAVATLSADERSLFVLAVIRRPPVWTIELQVVDVKSGDLLGDTRFDGLPVDVEQPDPSASPHPGVGTPDGVYAWASTMAASTDGKVLLVSVAYSEVRNESWTNNNREWMIPIDGGTVGRAVRLSPAATLKPEGWCIGRPTFVDPALLVQVCTPVANESPGRSFYIRRVTADGESVGDLVVPPRTLDAQYPASAIVDRARRAVFLWDAAGHVLTRAAIDDGQIDIGAVGDEMLSGDRLPGSGSYLGGDPGMVASPDGRRLYALGLGAGFGVAGRSTGVWVFDAETLELVDHWQPRAFLTSLAVSADGRFVYAAGAPGFDLEGHENPWPASVTVYDAANGAIQVIYGAIAPDTWVTFPTWP